MVGGLGEQKTKGGGGREKVRENAGRVQVRGRKKERCGVLQTHPPQTNACVGCAAFEGTDLMNDKRVPSRRNAMVKVLVSHCPRCLDRERERETERESVCVCVCLCVESSSK